MGTYLINFMVYTMAMVGLLFLGVMVYKKTMLNNSSAQNSNGLKVENALNLSPRKTLYIVKAGNEKFLIAADTERTTFLAKLNGNEDKLTTIEVEPVKTFKEEFHPQRAKFEPQKQAALDESKKAGVDYREVMKVLEGSTNLKRPVMRELLRKLDERVTTKE